MTIDDLWFLNLTLNSVVVDPPHSLQDFSFQCIDQINQDCAEVDKFLITKEAYWSAQLFTLSPHGLNKRQEFHSKHRIHFNS